MMGRKEAEDRDWVLGWEAVSMSDVREIDAADVVIFEWEPQLRNLVELQRPNLSGIDELGCAPVIVPIRSHTVDYMIPISEPDCETY
jgi:hypothetical protein